jgi:hypothetical protein
MIMDEFARRGWGRAASPRPASATMLALVLVALFGGMAEGQQPGDRVHGARVRAIQHQGGDIRGELIAVDDTRVWVLDRRGSLRSLPLADMRAFRVQRHGWSAGRIRRWTAIGAGATSAAMFGACISVEGTDGCAAFTLVWAAAWGVVGGVSGLIVRPSAVIAAGAVEELRPYARFPQGLPAGYPPPLSGTRE